MRMGKALGLPEMFGALAIDVRAAQSDIAQHAVVELEEQVSAPRAVPPSQEPTQQVREPPPRSGTPAHIAQPIPRKAPACIDTISMGHRCDLISFRLAKYKIDSE